MSNNDRPALGSQTEHRKLPQSHNSPRHAADAAMRLYVEAAGRTVPLDVGRRTDAASVLRKLKRPQASVVLVESVRGRCLADVAAQDLLHALHLSAEFLNGGACKKKCVVPVWLPSD